jgi:hypothetical protein
MGTDFLFYEGRKGTVMYPNVRVKIDALEGSGCILCSLQVVVKHTTSKLCDIAADLGTKPNYPKQVREHVNTSETSIVMTKGHVS